MATGAARKGKLRQDSAPQPPPSGRRRRVLVDDAQVAGVANFVGSAPIAVAMTDQDLRFMRVSPGWLADFGMTEDELIGRSSYDLAPETKAKYAELHSRSLAGETVSSEPERVVLPNGQSRWMMWEAAPWRDGQGRIGGLLITSRDVTAQKEAELEARAARAFAATILENVPSPLVVKDAATGKVLTMNRAMEDLYGVSREEHVGKTMHQLVDPALADALVAEDERVLSGNETLVVESAEMHTARGDVRIIRKMKVPIDAGEGRTYVLSISEDITERKRAADELERTRAFLTTVIESVPMPMVVKSGHDGRIVMANKANEEILGYARGELLGKCAFDLFPPDQAEAFILEDREVLANGELRVIDEAQISTPHKGVRSMRMMKVGIRDPDGQPCVLTICEDITERKKAAEELMRTQAFLETVIENVPAGLTVKDARDGRLLMLNPAVEEMYGVTPGENIGKTGYEIFPAEQAERMANYDRQVVESGEMSVVDAEPTWTRNGTRYIRKKKIVIRNPEGDDYLLSISEDVTDRKLAEDALKEALARAEAANVAKSEFLANMSHEIRTPLNGVLGLADALVRMELDPRQREIVEMIVSSGQALTTILGDVLDLAKAEAGALQLNEEPFSLRQTIGSAAFLFETVARDKGLDFRVEFRGDGPDQLVGDPLRIKQVVSNLISNAVKFTAKGEVSVRATARLADDGAVSLCVKVKDTGPGFSEEVQAKLFSRFEQGDGSITRRYGGTGLGLSIASRLAELMNGEVSCSAKVGKGATFVFTARLKPGETVRSETVDAGPAVDVTPARRLRILLAEDHEVNQRVVQLMLGDAADLVITGDGQQALDAFLAAPFDLVLMDTQMPVMDGLSAIVRIREAEATLHRARTPIVSLTANAMAHQVQACIQAGADLHLAKPITSEGLLGAIARALEPAPPQAQSRTA